jgi:hypothetical protein
MGIHMGAAHLKDDAQDTYEGYATLALTQRIMSVAHGGQILVSQIAQGLVSDRLAVGTELRDMGERRLKDIVTPVRIFQVVVADLPSEFPPLTTLDSANHNLPVQLTSFVGREQEIGDAQKLLSSTRILTFTGPGGTGKTRLSLQVAAADRNHHRLFARQTVVTCRR